MGDSGSTLTLADDASAGIPQTQLCLNCHSQVWNKSPLLEPVRESFAKNRPLEWRRVYAVPQFVYFNHSIHVNKGVGCVSCHGRVDQMPAVEKATPLTMGWCLECHRRPEPNLRPVEEVTNMDWKPIHEQWWSNGRWPAWALGDSLVHRRGRQPVDDSQRRF